MVERATTDGVRIAELLSSEIHGNERGLLGTLAVVDADTDAEPEESGAFVYGIDRDGERLADVYAHPDRVRIEFLIGLEAAAEAAVGENIHVRSKAVNSPRTPVFVENGAEVKRALRAIVAGAADSGTEGA